MATLFDRKEFKPYARQWQARIGEMTRRQRYYDGTAYNTTLAQLGWMRNAFAREVKPLYLPLARAVDIDVGIIPNRWTLADDVPGNIAAAKDTVFAWSEWSTDGVLLVHYGAIYGITGIKVSDLREAGIVQIKAVPPTSYMLIRAGEYGDTPEMAIQVEQRMDAVGEMYEYAEVITADSIRTFKDGEPFGFDGRDVEYKNELGFVPFVEMKHINTGAAYGENTYQKSIPMLDELNSLATFLADVVHKNAEPQWAVFGADADELVKSGENAWFLPQDARVEPIVPNVNIAGVLEFVREIRDQVRGSLPELSFDELRGKTQIATATIELQLIDLIIKIKRIRPNYDDSLVSALRMAGRAAASMGLSDIAVLDTDELRMDDNRDILPVSKEVEMRLEMQSLALEQERAAMDGGEGMNV